MTTPHDWPNVAYPDLTCCICGATFSGPHNAGKCYLHKDEPTPQTDKLVRCDYCNNVVSPKEARSENWIAALEAEKGSVR